MRIVPAAEESVVMQVADQPNEQALARIQWLAETIVNELGLWVTDIVPSFTTLTVYYDVLEGDYFKLRDHLFAISDRYSAQNSINSSRQIELPVYYGAEVALDLENIAEQTNLTIEQVIVLHSGQSYRVYALGFRPGFGFMANVVDELRVPRMATPRQKVPQGAVAIAEAQTAVYPSESPGGWNIIGNCPLPMFDRSDRAVDPKALLQTGDQVNFKPINRDEFIALGGCLRGDVSAV